MRQLLARLAGARPDVLARAPGDLGKQAAMGGVLLTTAGLAGVSAFFALHSALGLGPVAAVAAALVWFVVILNLDRMLVISMGSVSGFWHKAAVAVPRLALAFVIGAVVSTPLVLRIFQPEIEAELTSMRAEAYQRSQVELDAAFQQIEDLTAEERRLLTVIEGRDGPSVAGDPDVVAAKEAYERADEIYREAERIAQCELDGTCGSGVPGVGESQRQKRAAADRARADRDAAKRKLDEVTAAATDRMDEGAAAAVAAARAKLPEVQSDLSVAQERKRAAEADAHEAQNGNSGMLARLTALDRIGDEHSGAATARLMLFLLFLFVEILPILVKVLMSVGSDSLYDRIAARSDDAADADDELRVANDRKLRQAEEDARVAVAQQRVDAQIEVGRRATEKLVERQSAIALRSVEVWAEVAMARTDEELDRWYRAHVRPHDFGPTGSAPHGQTPYGQAPYGQTPYGQAAYGSPEDTVRLRPVHTNGHHY
ncbi:DUF4407 domain-containing protein [Actinokineospora sp. UTMC 2448]|uniref:DUF4407 domain-containing protein n=1 Tax=Actinokineospora sp. UTMC 2448 TaxID=2268449 RepID=UPI00216476B9|nr:DUF4407 domain-containing protein [Actinokineospora sp. UTMC 2448]UVS76925.1 hypothetical protein Actkin_00622 [Actinokineospora sp. UTMC 2448]